MPHRYAVLWEPGDPKAQPVGLAVEQDGFVLVEVREELALPVRYDQPFVVRGPDMTLVQYGPGDHGYFDQVLLDLSRSLIVANEGSVSEATPGVVLTLLRRYVMEPLRRERQVVYCDPSWPVVQAYQRHYYLSDVEESVKAAHAAPTSVREGVSALVAA
jgi:hypothetical protein